MGRKFRVKDDVKIGAVDYDIQDEMYVGNEYEDCFSDVFYKGDVYEVMNEHIINEYGEDEDGDMIEPELVCIEGKNKIELQELLSEETYVEDLYYSTIGMEDSSFCWEGVKGYFELID